MKRFLAFTTLLCTLFVPAVATGGAAAVDIFHNTCGTSGSSTSVCHDVNGQGGNTGTNNPVVRIIKDAINVLSFVIGVAAVIGVIVSALRMIISSGDSNAIATARSSLLYSLVGIAVVVLAQSIVVFVLDKL